MSEIVLTAFGLSGFDHEAEQRIGEYAAGIGDDYACAIRDAMTSDARAQGSCFAAELTRVASNRHEGA